MPKGGFVLQTNSQEYNAYVADLAPSSKLARNTLLAFCVGGFICLVGQLLLTLYGDVLALEPNTAATLTSATLILLSAVLTALSVYDDIAKLAGAGTLVPITGFANAVVSPAMEFKAEGFVTGMAAKMFIIAGPVIVYGTVASIVYGIVYYLVTQL